MIEPFESPDALAREAADATLAALSAAIADKGAATFVATGGRSPGPVYDQLAQRSFDWAKVSVTLSDERFVPPTDPNSNERLVRERLLVGQAAPARFTPLYRPGAADESASAALAEPEVRALAPFDAQVLGMGDDGHIASLIPGSPVLAAGLDPAASRWVIGVPGGVGSPPVARISLTLPALLQARLTLVLIAGAAKREIVENRRGLPVHALMEQAKAPVRVLWTP
jgi:6-phosphogluconolactonase